MYSIIFYSYNKTRNALGIFRMERILQFYGTSTVCNRSVS